METRLRGMLGGGPASHYPQTQSQQIRWHMPRGVTRPSSRYPQLCWVFAGFSLHLPSLRANGSRECAPDDRLREAIQKAASEDWIASSQVLLAMTAASRLTIRQRGPTFINSKPHDE